MKIFIAVLAIVAVVCADDWAPKTAEQIRDFRAQCIAENPLSSELLEKVKAFEFPDVEAVHKYVLCGMSKLGIFCEHEGFHVERIAKQFRFKDLDEAEVLEIAKGCADKNEEKSSAAVWAYRGHKCILASKIGDRIKEYIRKSIEAKKD